MTWFIDKLYIQQTYKERLPLVGDKFYYIVDGATGETSETPKAYQSRIQASHTTSIGVFCDGYKVRVEGNPSRFGRSENVMGLQTIEECVAVYNRILLSLGLPPFTTGTFDLGMANAKGKFRKIYSGAHITLIDITRNHSVGHRNERAFLRGIATLSLPNGKFPHLYPNGLTVDWQTKNVCGSSWDYSKVYVKAADLLDHQRRNLKGADIDTEEYYQKLISYCCESGVVREEHSFKSEKLKRYDLCYYGYVSTEQLANHHTLTTLDKLTQTLGVATVDFTSIASQLLNGGIVKSHSAAYATQAYCQQWLNGQPFHNPDRKKSLSSAYYVHKKRLLQLGIDISVPFCPTRASLPTFKNQREITMRTFELPQWYRVANARAPFQLVNGGVIA